MLALSRPVLVPVPPQWQEVAVFCWGSQRPSGQPAADLRHQHCQEKENQERIWPQYILIWHKIGWEKGLWHIAIHDYPPPPPPAPCQNAKTPGILVPLWGSLFASDWRSQNFRDLASKIIKSVGLKTCAKNWFLWFYSISVSLEKFCFFHFWPLWLSTEVETQSKQLKDPVTTQSSPTTEKESKREHWRGAVCEGGLSLSPSTSPRPNLSARLAGSQTCLDSTTSLCLYYSHVTYSFNTYTLKVFCVPGIVLVAGSTRLTMECEHTS